jgi:hypothetical protein
MMVTQITQLLKFHNIRYRCRNTKWGRTVTIPVSGGSGNWYLFEVKGGIGLTSTTDDPSTYVGPFTTPEEALSWIHTS